MSRVRYGDGGGLSGRVALIQRGRQDAEQVKGGRRAPLHGDAARP